MTRLSMSTRVKSLATAVTCLLLLATLAWAQRGMGRVQGQVTDGDGNPVEGVSVTAHNPNVSPSNLQATTGERGRWAIIGVNTDTWKFTFEKEGFGTVQVEESVRGLGNNPDIDVEMRRAAPAGRETEAVAESELFDEGNALFEEENYEGAIAKWQELLDTNPDLIQVHVKIGDAYRRMGDLEAARASYERVLEVKPRDTTANYTLGEMLVRDGRIEEAVPYFEKALEGSRDDAALYFNLGELYFSQGASDRAIVRYREALEVDPEYLRAWKQLGFAHVNAGNNQKAIEAFEKFIELAPADHPDLALVKDVLMALRGGDREPDGGLGVDGPR